MQILSKYSLANSKSWKNYKMTNCKQKHYEEKKGVLQLAL
jgi:hypothetical protein